MTIQILGRDQDARVEEIKKLVSKIASGKKNCCKLYDAWECRSGEIKDEDRQLCSILHDGAENAKDVVGDNALFESTSLDISKDVEKLDERYESFRVRAVYDESTIMIHGLKHERSKSIFEIRFKDKTMMEHFYFSILKTLEARITSGSLKELFENTTVPILLPDTHYKTASLMKEIMDEFSKDPEIHGGVLKLENEIEELEAKVDYMVFGIYGISKKDAEKILSRTAMTNWHANRVLQLFE